MNDSSDIWRTDVFIYEGEREGERYLLVLAPQSVHERLVIKSKSMAICECHVNFFNY